jgi:hypothetical protein
MNGNEGDWGGEISIISQNFPKSPSILFHPLDSSISQTSSNAAGSPGDKPFNLPSNEESMAHEHLQ